MQADDWLSKLADKFYGDIFAWPVIWEATNAKATEDDSFATIDNPDLIEIGQKLWIPDAAEAESAMAEEEAMMAETESGAGMTFEVVSFANNSPIPGEFAFCIPDPDTHATLGSNRSPHLRWSNLPESTQSLALILHDPDVPSVGDDVNQEGHTVSQDLPRVDFYHWVLVDIPATLTELTAGQDADGITAGGKPLGPTDYGVRGLNDYTAWFAGDADMGGDYGGYDGPCPPWNDELLHHYVFTLYALDTTLGLTENFSGPDALTAMEGHILDQAEWVGTYTLNPDVGQE